MGSTRKGEGLPAKTKDGSVCTIFNHADRFDHLLMLVGFLGSVGDGLSTPLMFFISSRIMNNVGHRPTTEPSLFRHAINENAVFLLYLACGSWVASFLEGYCWTRTGERQAARLKAKYLRAVLRKDESYFDLQECTSSEVVVAVSNDSFIIQDTLSEKVPNLIMNIATFVGCYAVSFLMQWKLAVAASPFVILLIIPGHVCGRILMNLAKKNKNEYKKAGAIAEQAISSIRTVYSFAGEAKTISDFSTALQGSITIGLKQGLAKGLAIGSYNISYAIWSFIAWYGSRLIMYHGAQGGNVYNAGTSIAVGGLCLGAGLVNVKYLTEAIAAYERISDVIKSKPTIDSDDMAGKILPHIAGEVEFKDVKFAYPSRSNNMILNNFCLQIPSGKTMALVGPSGSGKSTVIALLERLYDPIAGGILLDGVDIRRLQLKWLRSQMALVSQEPVLFATTIKENILFGKESATMEEIISAAKVANAHNFVSQLPLGYDTQVGERGIQMSGGQKQRIAIARAVIRAPKILLLDEATSALDMESERIVQEALHMVSTGRTTLTVTHRLSSVHNAHTIAVITDGLVLESGPHGELIHKQDGLYSSMVKLQQTSMTMSSMLGEESPDIVERSDCCHPKWVESKNEDEGENHEELSDREAAPSFWRLLFMNLPEWRHACIGCMSAVLVGAVQPVYAYAMGSVISLYFLHDHDEMKEKIRAYCLFFFFVAVVSVAFNMIQHYNFAAMGEYLTKRVRERVLSKILTFEVGWFDREENSTGAICSRIAKDANIVRSLVGDRMALLVQTFSAIVLSCTMGLIIAWRLALVMISVQPILIICFYARKVLLQRMSKKATKAQDESTKLAGEAVSNHRTVAAFCSQARVLDIFQRAQDGPRRLGIRQSWVAGVVLGASKSLIACTWALDFWYGGKLISDGSITSKALFQTFMILISTGRIIADAGSMTSDLAKGSDAVAAVFKVLDRCTQIEPDDPKAHVPRKLVGHVELKDVEFAYPARPHVIIFMGLSLDIEAGKSTGLVGPSGSGKSTVIGLVERFYDPQKGTVTIDGCDIRSYHLRSLRKQIALVGQEPALIAGTIRENIIYGFEGQVSETEIMDAARAANAHEFISCLQEGYDTWSGDSGVQLSGGQKQRIAIARALLKNPAVLLLDEPTSALDSQSEKLVQGALESAMVGRTVLVVAHRLSTIQNCHAIAVLKDGAIVEKGTHTTLMARCRNGSYYSLVASQNTDVQVLHQSN